MIINMYKTNVKRPRNFVYFAVVGGMSDSFIRPQRRRTLTSLIKDGQIKIIIGRPLLYHLLMFFVCQNNTLDTYAQQGKTMDNKLDIYVKTYLYLWLYGGPGGGGGGRGFNNQTGPILVHIYPLFNNNLHDKYRSNLIRTF